MVYDLTMLSDSDEDEIGESVIGGHVLGGNVLPSGSAVVQSPDKKTGQRAKITVYHTPEGEEVWDISSEDDI